MRAFDRRFLRELIDERCCAAGLAAEMGHSEAAFSHLLYGEREFKQDEMLCIAEYLELSEDGFTRCFFTPKSSEELNFDEVI